MTTERADSATALAIALANVTSSHRALTAALADGDLDEHGDLLEWSSAVTELLGSLTEHVRELLEKRDGTGVPQSAADTAPGYI
ncbi:hypothetical protein [Cumulibacter manganitolerans]|uniref:hypothetical protein n=1 Tax=Cumulibacter manganitolerans TaxID=1884992 RepID=UPI00129596D0|nr:hypothetical protein [Cumulibacter manganitolerans]